MSFSQSQISGVDNHHSSTSINMVGNALECTNSIVQIEMISRLNNLGCACGEGDASSADLPQAGSYFRRALDKANELLMFSEPKKSPLSTTTSSDPIGLSSFSDHLRSHVSKSLYAYQQEYDEGMHEYSDFVKLNADIVNSKNAAATITYNQGQLNLRMNNDNEALNCFIRALQLGQWGSESLGKVSNTGGVSLIAVLHNIGHVQYRNGQYFDAIKTYTDALDILRGIHTNDPNSLPLLELSVALNCLGVCHFHLPHAETEKALLYYREALAIRRAVVGQTAITKEIATCINNIGRVHYLRGEHDAALGLYSEALAMRRHLFGNDHLDVAATIYNAGQTLHHRRELDSALVLYEEFLTIVKKRLGYHHRDVAAMLKCVAQIKHECHEVEEATRLYKEAIEVGRFALGEYHPEVASILNKLGNLYYENNDLDKAVKVYQEGLQVERMVLDHDHPNIVVTITNIAQIYKLQEKYDLALNMYREAVSIQRRSLDASHPSISSTLSSVALIYYRTRRFTKALDVYQEVLRIRRAAYGDEHVEIAATLNSLGLVLFKMDLHDFAIQSFHESLRIRRELLGRNHRDVAVVLYNLATCSLEGGDDDRAMFYYRETLKVEKAALGESHPDVILTLLHCGQVLQGRGELSDALQYYDEALAAHARRGSNRTSDHITLARILNHKGNVFLQRGQAKELVDSLSSSLRHLKKAGKDGNDLIVSGFNFYALAKQHPECSAAA